MCNQNTREVKKCPSIYEVIGAAILGMFLGIMIAWGF